MDMDISSETLARVSYLLDIQWEMNAVFFCLGCIFPPLPVNWFSHILYFMCSFLP